VIKSTQNHRLAPGDLPHDILDGILIHTLDIAEKKKLVPFVNYPSDIFQIQVSHLYTLASKQYTLILPILMVSKTNLLDLCEFLPLQIPFNFSANVSITLNIGAPNLLAMGHSKSFQTISSTNQHSCLHLSNTFFSKGRKVMETSLKRSCLGPLYFVNLEAIQNTCKFKVTEAREKKFELAENNGAVYSTEMFDMNQVCQNKNSVLSKLTQAGKAITVGPGATFPPWTTSS